MGRIKLSRWANRRLLRGQNVMLSTRADQYRWRIRYGINLMFWDRDHCVDSSDWESMKAKEPEMLDDLRREGWL